MLPESAQVRKALWSAVNPHSGLLRLDEAFPHAIRKSTNKQDMSIEFKFGSSWQGVGSDNFQSLIGSPPVGLIFSEWSVANPLSWGYLSPILEENNGFAIFPYTPRGDNHGLTLFEAAKNNPTWFCELLTVDDTGIFSQKQLDQIKADLVGAYGTAIGESMFMQEYYCSFSSPILGAVYAEELDKAEHEGRVKRDLYDPQLAVYTAWDLGYSDATAIWWFQVGFDGVKVIDWYENSLQDVAHYAGVVLGRRCEQNTSGSIVISPKVIDAVHAHRVKYRYAEHYLPPDAEQKTLAAAGMSIKQQISTILPNVRITDVPNDAGLESSIQATRAVFPRLYFDSVRTLEGRRRLRQYHFKWNAETRSLSGKPVHDWSSHTSTAMHVLALSWRPVVIEDRRDTSKRSRTGWKV